MLVVQSHWGLHGLPFDEGATPKQFFCSEPHDEALARMHYVVDQGRQASILEGQSGSGKTLLSRLLCEEIVERGYAASWLNVRSATDAGIREQMASELGLPWAVDPNWERLGEQCQTILLERGRLVLALDDADTAAPEALEHLRALLDRQTYAAGCLTLILTARTATSGRLQGRLSELCDLRIELEPWSLADTTKFVQKSLAQVGGDPAIFDSQALGQIHERSGGVPREICRLARLTLLAAAGEGAAAVRQDTVQSVAEELVAS